ncbi:MAG: hypothetical protein FWF44_02750 [Defluviitaleaceae bacterium]|nr:hypothetical protein [Defluviitaleaceae bacterium]
MLTTALTYVYNFENAVRGARNAMNSWAKMDSRTAESGEFIFGEADLAMARKLCAAGSSHRKFLRQIFVSVDIAAPLYWWKEFDTYKVGTTANSQSTMHRIHAKPFDIADFSHEHMDAETLAVMEAVIARLEALRQKYCAGKDKADWYNIIQLLPSSYNQLRTCAMSYENLTNMYFQRKGHKLQEWREFCRWIEGLPYAGELIVLETRD